MYTQGRVLVARSWEEGRWELMFNVNRVSTEEDVEVLRRGSPVHNSMNVLTAIELYAKSG